MEELLNSIEENGPFSKINEIESLIEKPGFFSYESQKRREFIKNFSWAVPSEHAIEKITDFVGKDKCLEVGCGSGLWAKLLQLAGVDIIATDSQEEIPERYFTSIEKIDAFDAIKKYKDRNVLFLCWSRCNPTYEFEGNKIVYVGEGKGGCTNGIPDSSMWNLVEEVKIPQWFGINDYLALYERIK